MNRAVACRTPEQAERLRRAGYDVTIIAGPPRPPTSRRRPPRPAAKRGLSPEVLGSIKGPQLGRQYGHNPVAAAQALGYTIVAVPLATLQNPERPNVTIDGRLLPGRVIQVADTLRGRELHQVVAHELGHAVLGPDADEIDASCFARYFLAVSDDELPGANSPAATWRRWQNELAERERERARRCAAARSAARHVSAWG